MSEEQGDLDCLCGVYAVVNAFNILCKLRKGDKWKLFRHLILTLDKESYVTNAILTGTYKRHISLMLEAGAEHIRKRHRITVLVQPVFKSNVHVGMETYWKKLHGFLEHQRSAAVIGMEGKHHHWACVKALTRYSIVLEDSDGIPHLRKDLCRISSRKSLRQELHYLTPTHTWGLSIKK